jgi:hypothetical protein
VITQISSSSTHLPPEMVSSLHPSPNSCRQATAERGHCKMGRFPAPERPSLAAAPRNQRESAQNDKPHSTLRNGPATTLGNASAVIGFRYEGPSTGAETPPAESTLGLLTRRVQESGHRAREMVGV